MYLLAATERARSAGEKCGHQFSLSRNLNFHLVPSVSETIVVEVSNLIFEAPVRCSDVCEEGYLVVHDGTYLF